MSKIGEEKLLQFPVGPNQMVPGRLIKAAEPDKELLIKYARRINGNLEVKLPDERWYSVKPEDYFGAWV